MSGLGRESRSGAAPPSAQRNIPSAHHPIRDFWLLGGASLLVWLVMFAHAGLPRRVGNRSALQEPDGTHGVAVPARQLPALPRVVQAGLRPRARVRHRALVAAGGRPGIARGDVRRSLRRLRRPGVAAADRLAALSRPGAAGQQRARRSPGRASATCCSA
jgi:hypothetical protein